MQCPSCHAEVESAAVFCNRCGANLSGGPAAASTAPPASAPAASGLSNNAAAAIAYITIIPAIIFLLLEPYNRIPLVRFHSFQSIGLALVWIVAHFALLLIPVVGWIVGVFVSIGLFIVWLITLLKASKGEWFKLPIIGNIAEQQAKS